LTTLDTGYIQVLQDKSQTEDAYDPNDPSPKDLVIVTSDPVCNVVVNTVTVVGYKEKSDCSDKMIATVTGTLTSEITCSSVVASVKLISSDNTLTVGRAQPVLQENTSDPKKKTYSFTADIEADNAYGNYYANLEGYDKSNEADKDSKDSVDLLWEPPCCLTIPKFTKDKQETSLDGLRTDLSYTVQLAQ